ncbi:LON peptidase substrate-binding domain-containing protein [Rhodopila sp.]|uniref:LON peptidase substrate-binding domain-containing protein n=1 Tax=Rhodopila sp. TaxID=2480087 RepID=UPI002BCB4A59|nr:LON peptidase substrate-binding domain-containing protein [Rhodopila sp.]HVZ06670.1 LON peptidase substrate-binding domain-containing protein [Rhodopila sp.]
MAAFRPRPQDLPTEFPIFPLEGALLLPGGRLPLNIFEPRYLAMTLDSLGAGRMFAMVQPDPAQPPVPNGPALYRVGCLGRVSSFSETDDGRLLITLTGLIRFAIDSELDMVHGYRRVRGDFSRYLADLDELSKPAAFDREKLTEALRCYFQRRQVDANWDAIRRMPTEALVVTLAMACPFEPVEKQALLEAPTPADRGATLLALLQMGAAGPPDPPSGHSVS